MRPAFHVHFQRPAWRSPAPGRMENLHLPFINVVNVLNIARSHTCSLLLA